MIVSLAHENLGGEKGVPQAHDREHGKNPGMFHACSGCEESEMQIPGVLVSILAAGPRLRTHMSLTPLSREGR